MLWICQWGKTVSCIWLQRFKTLLIKEVVQQTEQVKTEGCCNIIFLDKDSVSVHRCWSYCCWPTSLEEMNISILHPLSVNALDPSWFISISCFTVALCLSFTFIIMTFILWSCLSQGCFPSQVWHSFSDLKNVVLMSPMWLFREARPSSTFAKCIRCRLSPFIMLFPCHLKMRSMAAQRDSFLFTSVA